MKVKYIGEQKMDFIVDNNEMDLITNKVYEVQHIDKKYGGYGIIDESGEEYGYPPEFFEIVEGSVEEFEKEDE